MIICRNKWYNCILGSFLIIIFSILMFLLLPSKAYAVERAYLYFYTVDGEEIEELEKNISVNREYTFENPDDYKYIPYEGENGEEVYNENYDLITGIYWEELKDNNSTVKYEEGDTTKFEAGDHYFYVKSDHPELTGENLLNLSNEEQAHLYFYNANGDEIYSLEKALSPKDEFTFPEPDEYDYWYESGEDDSGSDIEADEDSDLTGKGIYWWCEDDNDKQYLFEGNQKVKFKAGDYEFYIRTDDPVNISFFYPIDYETDYVADNMAGGKYAEMTGKVGDTITLKRSLGALIWESTFQGWEEVNVSYPDKILSGGASYRIMNNSDLDFFAVYEEDENWDPTALDENTGESVSEKEEINIVDIEKVNEAAGAGYGAYIDASGVLTHTGGNIRINSNVAINGIPGTIKKQNWLSSMIDKDGDVNDPENYKYDKYGKPMEESELPAEINNVLRQDDSAMYMDVYGNSFIYYSDLTRQANMNLALERLSIGKTDSWVKNVSNWEPEMINRFEAIEFAILKGSYPAEGEELVTGVTWKNSYMSEAAYKRLLSYRKLWKGWYDTYTDGLYEKYKTESGSGGITTVGFHSIKDLFGITAYAAEGDVEKNSSSLTGQFGSRANVSSDLKNVKLKPQYYKPSQMFKFSSYAFSGLDGLSSEQVQNLGVIFNALVSYGYTEEMAAGACGNIWQESGFKSSIEGGGIGIIQWTDTRANNLKSLASSQGKEWTDISVQVDFMIQELNESINKDINGYLSKYSEYPDTSTVKDVTAACEAWCVKLERCTCINYGKTHSAHNEKCSIAANGLSYQHLLTRNQYAQKVYNAMTKSAGFIGGDFANMSNAEIIGSIFPGATSVSGILDAGYTEEKIKRDYIITAKTARGTSIAGGINKYVADDVIAALNELEDMGFPIRSLGGYYWRNVDNSPSLSFHSVGLAIDINANKNGNPVLSFKNYVNDRAKIMSNLETGNTDQDGSYSPKTDPGALRVVHANVLRKYNWLWGRDFSTKADLMHFSIGEVYYDLINIDISNYFE